MGWKLERREYRLCPNEEKDVCIILCPECRAAIHGVVRFPDGKPVKDALVKLFVKKPCMGDKCNLVPVTFSYTDDCGQFLFGVNSNVNYVVKVFFYCPEHRLAEETEEAEEVQEVETEAKPE